MIYTIVNDKRTKDGFAIRKFEHICDLFAYMRSKKISSFLVKKGHKPLMRYTEVEPHFYMRESVAFRGQAELFMDKLYDLTHGFTVL